jgi:general secretion pathway protein F
VNRLVRALVLGLLGGGVSLCVGGGLLLRIEGAYAGGLGFIVLAFLLHFGARAVRIRVGTARVPPEFRDGVLRVLAAAARRGESAGGALAAVAEEVRGRRRRIALHALARLDGGASFADALGDPDCPFLTPEQAESVRAAEGTGRVSEVLLACVGVEADRLIRMRMVTAAAVYALLLSAHGAFVATTIFPQFATIASQMADPDSGLNPILAGGLDLLEVPGRAYPVAFQVSLLAVLLLVTWNEALGSPRAASILRSVLLPLPGPGTVIRLDAGERVCRALGIAVAAGRPLHEALSRAAATAGVRSLRASLEEAAVAVAEGAPLARAVEGAGLPRFAEARIVLASAGSPEAFGRALQAVAAECADRSRGRALVLAAGAYPAVLAAAAALAYLTYRGVFLVLEGIRYRVQPW